MIDAQTDKKHWLVFGWEQACSLCVSLRLFALEVVGERQGVVGKLDFY